MNKTVKTRIIERLTKNFHMDISLNRSRRQFLKESCFLLGGLSLYSCSSDSSETPTDPGSSATPPIITLEPADTTVLIGSLATFQVTTNETEPPAFQWYRDGQNIPGATEASYTLRPASISENGSGFSVNITNQAGSVSSRLAILSIATIGTTVDTTAIQIDTTLITIDEV